MKLLATTLFLFMSFQTLGGEWFYSKNMKIECRFTSPLEIIHYPEFDCSGDMTDDLSYICRGSVECKNHENITTQFPAVLCKSSKTSHCNSINPIKCLLYYSSNKELRDMIPDETYSPLPPKEVIRVIEEK